MAGMNEGDHIRRQSIVCASALRDSLVWSVTDRSMVDLGQVLGSVGLLEHGNHQQLAAPCRGQLRMVTEEQIQSLIDTKEKNPTDEDKQENSTSVVIATEEDGKDALVTVAYVEYCTHPLRNGRTCLMCLAIVDDDEDSREGERQTVNVISHGQVIRLNIEEAKKFDFENIKRQLSSRKLSLVLDLDHTLLHAVRVEDVVGEIPKTDDTHFFYIPGLGDQQHVVKLRPGLQPFLEELSGLYDLFIYTHGTRLYAEQIANIIDPKHKFFQHRIVARTDTPDMHHKSLKLLFPSCDDSMILVLDDRIDVWKENEGNVFLIEPYHYFKCTAEINNTSGRGVLDIEDEETDVATDNHLAHTMKVLKNIHESFYDGHDNGEKGLSVEDQMAGRGQDVKAILSQQKRDVLRGCNIVFSGVFPIGGNRGPETHYLWKLAVDLGATPSMVLQNFPITHLVIHPNRLGTQKHVQAQSMPNVSIVVPEWVFKCARTWTRVPEEDFLASTWKAKHEKPVPAPVVLNAASANGISVTTHDAQPIATCPETAQPMVSEASTTDVSVLTSTDGDANSSIATVAPSTTEATEPTTNSKKKMKTVTFATVIDDSGKERKEEDDMDDNKPASMIQSNGPSSLRQRRAPMRRVVGGSHVGSAHIPANKGVVASGGTFDFLSKITKIGADKREQKKPQFGAKQSSTAKETKHVEAPPKDVDDAFLRLIEAEERENAIERKRKLESDDVRDQLANRRLKTGKPTSPIAEKTEQTVKSSEDEGDEDLDDLEADILGDL